RMQEVKGGDDAADARWFALDEVPQLAFDHDQILRKAEQALRQQIHFESVGFELLPEEFTIKELQNLYEAILDVRFDRRNFYNKMKRLEMLDLVDGTVNRTSSERRAELVRAIPSEEEEGSPNRKSHRSRSPLRSLFNLQFILENKSKICQSELIEPTLMGRRVDGRAAFYFIPASSRLTSPAAMA
ncbi:MAG: hypothetical protein MSA20_04150, partial [Bacteroidales bacterium]|nr:hypothetical protein [Bacteroidales bacterium]